MSYGFIRANLTASVPPFMDGGGLNPRSAFLFNNSDYGVKPDPISFLRLDLFQKTVVWGFDLDIYFIGLHLHQAVAFFSPVPLASSANQVSLPRRFHRSISNGMTTSLFIGGILE
jgi:hypothetical protein